MVLTFKSGAARVMHGVLLASCCFFAQTAGPHAVSEHLGKPRNKLIVVLIDGGRWDMISEKSTPNLARLARRGASAEMIPVWPTISSPNHWALATGLYPANSGIYDNSMFDSATGAMVDVTTETRWDSWARGVPVWATVANQGGISAVIGRWVGAQLTASAIRPTYYFPYIPQTRGDSAINDTNLKLALTDYARAAPLILQLFDNTEISPAPDFIGFYAVQPDAAEHHFGVGSKRARESLQELDRMIGALDRGLETRDLSNHVNVIVVSDHGHTNIKRTDHLFYLDDILPMDQIKKLLADDGPSALAYVWPTTDVKDFYSKVRSNSPHLHVWRGSDLPPRWHCCQPTNTPPVLITVDPGYWLTRRTAKSDRDTGTHGLDNGMRDMHSLFVAAGPDIKPGVHIEPFPNVDVHSLMTELLAVKTNKTDGSLAPLCPILRDPPASCASKGGVQ